jgi:hypothetical protein
VSLLNQVFKQLHQFFTVACVGIVAWSVLDGLLCSAAVA